MPVGINQPSNQIKLTNVSLVRLKKGKKRFEIACYKNKVLEFRSGAEPDLDNVLQIRAVFLHVSKGQTAPAADLAAAFGAHTPLDTIILEILRRGEMQVGEKERHAQLERVHHEVVDIVAGKVVDPTTKRVYTAGMIEKALERLSGAGGHAHHKRDDDDQHQQQQQQHQSDGSGGGGGGEGAVVDAEKGKDLPMWTGVVMTKSAKIQALDAMKALIAWQPIPIARARMRLRVSCPQAILKHAVKLAPRGNAEGEGEGEEEKGKGTVKDRILGYVEEVESQDEVGSEWEVVGFVEPGAFKRLRDFIEGETKGRGRVEVLDMAVMHEGG